MDNPRPEKVAVVDEVRDKFSGSSAAILTDYRGLNVDAMARLRSDLRDAGGEFKIYKNTLVRLAVADLDLEIAELLSGPTAIAFVTETSDGQPGDAVSVAKALDSFASDHPSLVIKGGLLRDQVLSVERARELAKVAPREELLARFAGGLAAPLQRFAGLLQALPRDFAYALSALVEKGGASEAAASDDVPGGAGGSAEPAPTGGDPAEAGETTAGGQTDDNADNQGE